MSLNHILNFNNSGIDIKTNSIKTKLDDGTYSNLNIPELYILDNDNTYTFINELPLIFNLHRQGNLLLNSINNHKILVHINIMYKWGDNETPPDYTLNVYINGISIYKNIEGLNDYTNSINKLNDTIILDITKNDIISLKLLKINSDDTFSFRILKNSFYSIELL